MDDQRAISAPIDELIDRIVRHANIPSRAARADLRRELETHFEDAGPSAELAIRRFGDEAALAAAFRRVHRWDYLLLYFAKIAASIVVSATVALAIEVLVNLRVELQAEAIRLAPGFTRAAPLSVAIVLGLAAAWEIGRRPFDGGRAIAAIAAYAAVCALVELVFAGSFQIFGTATALVASGYACSRLERRPTKLAITFCAFAAGLYAVHSLMSVAFGPARALAAGAILVAVWTSTIAIFSRCDHAFHRVFESSERG